MKKTIILLIIGFCTLGIHSQNNNRHGAFQNNSSSIYVYAEAGEAFYLVVNGIRQNYFPQSNVQVSGLTNDDYQVQVVFKNNQFGSLHPMNVRVVNSSHQYGQSVYKLSINPLGYYEISLEQFFPGFTLTPTNRSHHVVQYHNTVYTQAPVYHHGPVDVVVEDVPAPNPMPGYNGELGCGDWPLSDQDFARALQSIRSKTYDRTKLVVAMQITRSNCLTANQVKQIAACFTYDTKKLEYAKFAYDHTYDIGNYFIVNDVFTYDNNSRELSEYISAR